MTVSTPSSASLPTSASLQDWAKQLLAHTSLRDGVLHTAEEAEFLLERIGLHHGEETVNLTRHFVVRMHNLIRREADELLQLDRDAVCGWYGDDEDTIYVFNPYYSDMDS